MRYYFDDDFISQVSKLLKKKSYIDCEKALIDSVFEKKPDEFLTHCQARKITGGKKLLIAKVRISYNTGKSGAYRLYLAVYIEQEKLHFGFIFPKTGSKGRESLNKKKEEPETIDRIFYMVKSKNYKEVIVIDDKICYKNSKQAVWE